MRWRWLLPMAVTALAVSTVMAVTVGSIGAIPWLRGPGSTRAGDQGPPPHRDSSRSGYNPAGPSARSPVRAWAREDLDAPVYAEPLVFQGQVYVVTEGDTLYALSASKGRVDWRLHLAAPAVAPIIHCTAIVPLGITSTPVIDPATSRLYTAAVVDTVRGNPRYQTWLFAVDLRTRSVAYHVRGDGPGASIA